jgi:hypothetical protein
VLLFIGNGASPLNVLAMRWLVTEILPLINVSSSSSSGGGRGRGVLKIIGAGWTSSTRSSVGMGKESVGMGKEGVPWSDWAREGAAAAVGAGYQLAIDGEGGNAGTDNAGTNAGTNDGTNAGTNDGTGTDGADAEEKQGKRSGEDGMHWRIMRAGFVFDDDLARELHGDSEGASADVDGPSAPPSPPPPVCRIFVSPMVGTASRTGGDSTTGIATKNVLAMAHGIPLVTTSSGAQGLQYSTQGLQYSTQGLQYSTQGLHDVSATNASAEPPPLPPILSQPFIVRNDAAGFASAIATVCHSRALATQLAVAGAAHADRHFSQRAQLDDVLSYLSEVGGLEAPRSG